MTYPPQQPEPNQQSYVPYGTDPYSEPPQPQGPYPPHQLPPGQPVSPAPYGPPPQVIVVPATNPQTSTWAVLGLVFSILGLVSGCCTFGAFSIAAVICGHAGLRETSNNSKGGHGMAVAALVMGYIGIIPAIFLSIAMVNGALTGAVTPTPTP